MAKESLAQFHAGSAVLSCHCLRHLNGRHWLQSVQGERKPGTARFTSTSRPPTWCACPGHTTTQGVHNMHQMEHGIPGTSTAQTTRTVKTSSPT
eukprot:2154331-Amphidinium_carterae.1